MESRDVERAGEEGEQGGVLWVEGTRTLSGRESRALGGEGPGSVSTSGPQLQAVARDLELKEAQRSLGLLTRPARSLPQLPASIFFFFNFKSRNNWRTLWRAGRSPSSRGENGAGPRVPWGQEGSHTDLRPPHRQMPPVSLKETHRQGGWPGRAHLLVAAEAGPVEGTWVLGAGYSWKNRQGPGAMATTLAPGWAVRGGTRMQEAGAVLAGGWEGCPPGPGPGPPLSSADSDPLPGLLLSPPPPHCP